MMLRPYQEVGRDFLALKTRALLADEMRLGKSAQAITAADKCGAKKILTVCPAIGVPHWQEQWNIWSPSRPKAYALNSVTPQFTSQLTVASYDMAAKYAMSLRKQEWDVLIVDECHFAKNPQAIRTGIIYGKENLGWSSRRIWALSGTPAPRHAGELWPMLRAFNIVHMDYWDFIRRYCRCDATGRAVGTIEARIPELRELLAKIMLRRKRKEVAPDMADIEFEFLEIKPAAIANIIIPTGLDDASMLKWLDENANQMHQQRMEVAKAKVSSLVEEIVFSIGNCLINQTVVFGYHVEPLEQLSSVLNAKGIPTAVINGKTSMQDRVAIQNDFKYNRLSVIAVNIIAGGTVISFSAANHAYFLELDWVPGNNVQAANRLIDMEKREPVTVDVVTWPNSFDSKIQRVIMRRVKELSKLY